MALTKVTGSVIKDSVSLSGNVSVGGTLTYQDVTNVDALGIGTFRTGIKVLAGQVDIGSNIKLGNAGVITATSFVGSGANLTGIQVGGASSLSFNDSVGLYFGDSQDLKIHHDSNHSYIDDQGTGNLRLRSGTLEITNLASNKTSALFSSGGGQTLNFNNSAKFATTNTGVVVTGIVTSTSRLSVGNNTTNAVDLEFGTNRGSAGQTLANINWKWNNTYVAQIRGMAGSDTTNKDDAHLTFYTAASGSLVERLRIASDGNLLASGITTSNAGFMFGTDGEMYLYKSAANTATLRVTSDGPYAEFKDVSGDLHMGSASGSLRLSASGAEKVRITSSATHFGSSGTLNDSNTVSIIPSDGRISFGMDGRTSYVTGETACYIYSGEGSSGTTLAGELILQSRSNVNRNITFVTGATPTVQMIVYGSGGVFAHTKNNFLLNEFRRGDTSSQFGALSTSWTTDTTISDTISNYQRGQRIIIRATVPCGIALSNGSAGANYGGTNVRVKVTGNTSGGATYSNNRATWYRADGAGTHETTMNLFICVYINENDTTFSNGETLTVNLQGQKNGGGVGSATHYLGGWSTTKEITIERYIKEL